MVAKRELTTREDVRMNYRAVKFMNIACECKDKADHDNAAAKEQLNKIRNKRGR